MTTMLEKAAKAACEVTELFGREEEVIRAALQAIREPDAKCSDAALSADLDINWSYAADGRPGGPDAVFTAMIDAILGEKA